MVMVSPGLLPNRGNRMKLPLNGRRGEGGPGSDVSQRYAVAASPTAARQVRWAKNEPRPRLSLSSGLAGTIAGARQADDELGELSRLAVDVDAAAVLLDDDVVAHRQPKPGAFAGRLGGEE